MIRAALFVAALIAAAAAEGYGAAPAQPLYGIPPQQSQGGYYAQGPPPPPAMFQAPFETRTPLGALAGFKGDLLFPIFHVAFFVIGVIITVKVLLGLVGLIKGKIFSGLQGVALERRRRDTGASDAQIDGLTNVVMAALEGQECLQRMTCELGGFVRQYDQGQLLSGIAERFASREMTPYVDAFKNSDNCVQFRCGRLAVRK